MENNQQQNDNKTEKLDAKRKLGDISHIEGLPASSFSTDTGSKTIKEFLIKYDNELINYPSMQRGNVWNANDEAELIESLIKGIPIPPIYINKNSDKGREVWEILDGRQRLTTIFHFFDENSIKINPNLPQGYENLQGYTFEEMKENNPALASEFKAIPLSVVWMDNASESMKSEFFQKLNKGGKALTPGELAHSTLSPASKYMKNLLKVPFYKLNMHESERFAQYVPLAKILHVILSSMQVDNSFVYHPIQLNGWKDRITNNPITVQTDLDNLHDADEKIYPYLKAEVERVCGLINEIFGKTEVSSSNNQLLTNMIIALLILEDPCNAQAMSHIDLRQSFEGMIKVWEKGHAPILRRKMKTELANITHNESILINECDKMSSKSKTAFADVLENLRNDTYSNYV